MVELLLRAGANTELQYEVHSSIHDTSRGFFAIENSLNITTAFHLGIYVVYTTAYTVCSGVYDPCFAVGIVSSTRTKQIPQVEPTVLHRGFQGRYVTLLHSDVPSQSHSNKSWQICKKHLEQARDTV